MILPHIPNTDHWINIILGTVGKSDAMNDFIVFEVTLICISLFSDFIRCVELYLVGIFITPWKMILSDSADDLIVCRSS